jgi:hypothetical protein
MQHQPLFINMTERQQQIEPLASYTMSPQGYDDEWGCTLTAKQNLIQQFSSGKDDKRTPQHFNTTT